MHRPPARSATDQKLEWLVGRLAADPSHCLTSGRRHPRATAAMVWRRRRFPAFRTLPSFPPKGASIGLRQCDHPRSLQSLQSKWAFVPILPHYRLTSPCRANSSQLLSSRSCIGRRDFWEILHHFLLVGRRLLLPTFTSLLLAILEFLLTLAFTFAHLLFV